MMTFIGRRERLTYSDWRKLGWDDDAARYYARDECVVEAFLYLRDDGEEYRLAVDEPAGARARRRDEHAFEWGYGGSGPHATARAILGAVLNAVPSHWLSQQFKTDVISRQPREGFEVTVADVGFWAEWTLNSMAGPYLRGRSATELRELRTLTRKGRHAKREESTR